MAKFGPDSHGYAQNNFLGDCCINSVSLPNAMCQIFRWQCDFGTSAFQHITHMTVDVTFTIACDGEYIEHSCDRVETNIDYTRAELWHFIRRQTAQVICVIQYTLHWYHVSCKIVIILSEIGSTRFIYTKYHYIMLEKRKAKTLKLSRFFGRIKSERANPTQGVPKTFSTYLYFSLKLLGCNHRSESMACGYTPD